MGTQPTHPARSLLITGTVGAGKTTITQAIGGLLADRGVPHALIDLDELRRCWPSPDGDRFNNAMELQNLRSVAANYMAAGAIRLVLAGVVERRSNVRDYERAVDCTLEVVRLRVDLDVLVDRLRDRHRNDPAELTWHLDRAPELNAVLDHAGVTNAEVDTTGRLIPDVAADVLAAVGW